jgi:pimeloyl-ACP methyl ester carboxylesterase
MTGQSTTSIDGTTIAYPGAETERPSCWCRGTAADHRGWAPVCAVDRRSRGGSGDTATYAIEREFDDLAAVVDSLGEPVHLLGHSYGAFRALEAAIGSDRTYRQTRWTPRTRHTTARRCA